MIAIKNYSRCNGCGKFLEPLENLLWIGYIVGQFCPTCAEKLTLIGYAEIKKDSDTPERMML